MRICIVGDPEDLSAAYVGWLARERGLDVCPLPEASLGLRWSFRLERDRRRSALEVDGTRVPLADVAGAFVRLNPRPSVPAELGLAEEEQPLFVIERRNGLHWLLDGAPFPVVNRPRSGRANGSKPVQMRMLAEHGFRVPTWIATNDAAKAEEFIRSCSHGAICKSCSGLRSRVRLATDELVKRLAAGSPPVLLQSYVPGRDVRVHVVGELTFATEISSPGIDYRFDPGEKAYSAIDCPEAIAALSVGMAAREGLLLAGLDFRVAPDESWWCLEMNPVPTFLPYEAAAGHPIGERVLDLLAPCSKPRSSESTLSLLFDRSPTEGSVSRSARR